MAFRGSFPDFHLANPLYAAARVSFYTVDEDGAKTDTLATLYAAATGSTTVANPQTLDSDGKLSAPVYIDEPVIAEAVGQNIGSHTTGIINARGTWRGVWTVSTIYRVNDFVRHPDNDLIYVVAADHVSDASDIADDITAGLVEAVLDPDDVLDAALSIVPRTDEAQAFSDAEQLQGRQNLGMPDLDADEFWVGSAAGADPTAKTPAEARTSLGLKTSAVHDIDADPTLGEETFLDPSGETPFGSMTLNGGLAAAFDGDTSQISTDCARKGNATNAYIGLQFDTPKIFAGALIYGSSDAGFMGSDDVALTINIYGNNTAPADSNDGTLLGTVTFDDTTDESAGRHVDPSAPSTTAYSYLWAELVRASGDAVMAVAELRFLSAALPTQDAVRRAIANSPTTATAKARAEFEIDPDGLTTFGDLTATGGLAAAFDGDTTQAAADCAARTAGADGERTAYAGLEFTTGKIFAGAVVHGSNDQGFIDGGNNPSVTLNIYGKNGTPADSDDGTLIGTLSITDTADESEGRLVESTDAINSYTHIWVEIVRASGGGNLRLAELVLFEHKTFGVVRSAASRAGDVLNAFDYGLSHFKTDNASQLQAAFDDAGEIGGTLRLPRGDFEVGSKITTTPAKAFRVECERDSRLIWPSGVSTAGIEIKPTLNTAIGFKWSGGELLTGVTTPAHTALYWNFVTQVNSSGRHTSTYGIAQAGEMFAVVEDLIMKGFEGITTDAWKNGLLSNTGRHIYVNRCNFLGKSAGFHSGANDLPDANMGMAFGFISRDEVEELTITGITNADPAVVTYATTSAHPANDAFYFIDEVLGMPEVNGRTFKCANVAAGSGVGTFELSNVDSSAFGTYTSGGIIEASPQTTSMFIHNSRATWARICAYGGNTEGFHIRDSVFLNSFITMLKDQQLSFAVDDIHAVSITAGIQAIGVSRLVVIRSAQVFANQEITSVAGAAGTTYGIDLVGCGQGFIGGGSRLNQSGSTIRLVPVRLRDCAAFNVPGFIIDGITINSTKDQTAIVLEGATYNTSVRSNGVIGNPTDSSVNNLRRIVDDQSTGTGNIVEHFGGHEVHKYITLDTADATTSTGITPTGRVQSVQMIVREEITGLDSADHHVQVGVSGTTDKYIDKANGSSATSIAQNIKDHYTGDPASETAELIITITGGADNTPTGGVVELRVVYLPFGDLLEL